MACMECGLSYKKVDNEAICKGYRLAFPENVKALDEWLEAEDEYSNW